MKFTLFLFASILVCATFALPVPDEEVSPVQAATVPEVKPVVAEKPEEKLVEVVKPESRSAADEPKPILLTEEKLPLSAPDAELASALPEKKEEKPLLQEKQIRSEEAVEQVKALPVVSAPVAGVAEEQKQVVEEVKPVVQESVIQAVAKSADLPIAPVADQKRDELSAAEETPAVKSDIVAESAPIAAAAATAEPAAPITAAAPEVPRQERNEASVPVAEVKVEDTNVVQQVPAVVAVEPVESVVVPAVKSLPVENEQSQTIAEPIALPAASAPAAAAPLAAEAPATPELKTVAAPSESKIEQPQAAEEPIASAATAIPQQPLLKEAESNTKALEPEQPKQEQQAEQQQPAAAVPEAASALPEAKKIEEPVAPLVPETPIAIEQPKQPEAPAAAQEATTPLKKLEDSSSSSEEKPSELKNTNDSKDSKESEESKESAESKEDNKSD